MVVESSFVLVILAAVVGLAISVVIEQLMTPRPCLVRSWRAWGIHVAAWLLSYAVLALLLGRPWFAAAGVSSFLLVLVLVSNAKVKTLHEPFIFQDYEYFTDAIRHPRLYIPFMGWGKFLSAAAGVALAVAVGLSGESVPVLRFTLSGQLGGVGAVLGGGLLILLGARSKTLPVSLDPERDIRSLGLLASLWRYGEEERCLPAVASPFDRLVPKTRDTQNLPHLVAVQSESFFDPRPLYSGIRDDVLAEFDRFKSESLIHGKLSVPAWGANTVRTEFSFLSGMSAGNLGVHCFNPYRTVAAGWNVPSLASFLKRLGYRTICIHPYPASFYRRDRVCPRLGFDEFLDIRAFDGAKRFGPYISDAAVADKIASILADAISPVFVFAITMENHGPLHLERVESSDIKDFYGSPPPAGCEDLTIYLRHIRNADRMIGELRKTLERCSHSAGLCWYGDHVPIMPSVYSAFGAPIGDVEFVYWTNQSVKDQERNDLFSHQLSVHWLRAMDIVY